ncbi:MAG: hypothetical protein KA715_06685 [Xanthomonadaceae bacterium]|nr:hypothetical protein [Xanthomonadaceae bacterium]
MNKSVTLNPFFLYEQSVQTTADVDYLLEMAITVMGRVPLSLREDFCGTHLFAREYVKRDPRFKAIGLDLDPLSIKYGTSQAKKDLTPEERKRLKIYKKNVISVTKPKSDWIVACNFSFYIFHERDTLVEYFKKAHQSLTKDGIFMLELGGGSGFLERLTDRRVFKVSQTQKVTYLWHQLDFNPVKRQGHYAISFKVNDVLKYKHAFKYDWRVWTIPEVRDVLKDAGFSRSVVLVEKAAKGRSSEGYEISEEGDHDHSWISYVVGIR